VLAGYVIATVTTQLNEPIAGAWVKDFPMNFTFVCSGNSTSGVGYNATLYHNVGGSWKANYTQYNLLDGNTYNFTEVNALPDNNTGYIWNVECKNNLTAETAWGTNRTFKVDTTSPTVPEIDQPANNSVIGSTNPFINWSITTETNFKQYKIQFANDTDFDSADILKQQIITVRTINSTTFTESLEGNRQYWMRVLAEDEAGNTAYEYINVTVVTTAPTISIVNFSDNHYISDNTPPFAIVATHQFVSTCELYINGSGNWAVNVTDRSGNGTLTLTPATAMADGHYAYSFRCNNTGGNWSSFTANRTIVIDTVAPAPFGCYFPANNTKSIDHTPELRWNVSTDVNFGNYTITLDNDSDFSSPEVIDTVSSQDTNYYVANLRGYDNKDRNWYWRVNSSDLAGNTRLSTNCSSFYYRTDITNHYLKSGWNVVAIMQSGTINASDLGEGLGVSWVTISKYNASKQFQNYNNGTSTNADMVFKKGDVVFININTDTYWENQTWDVSSDYTDNGLFNLTNTTNNWNLFGIQNQTGRTIGNIEQMFLLSNVYTSTPYEQVSVVAPKNESLQFITYFNNTAISTKKYVPHPYNYSFNNDTLVDFGEVVWINLNATWNVSTTLGEVGYFTINRSLI
jgi:hypothetical protein